MDERLRRSLRDIDGLILGRIADGVVPIGQGALGFFLQKQGVQVSTPTIGRRLQFFEHHGWVKKIGVDGRVITPQGRGMLQQLRSETLLRSSAQQLLTILRQADDEIILDLLAARRVIECENASRAAERATAKAVKQLEAIIDKQQEQIDQGRLGLEFDIEFHLEVARLADNPVLYSLTAILRRHEAYNVAVASASAVFGHHSVRGHRAIAKALAAHLPRSARAAMAEHLDTLMRDLRNYWIQGDSGKRRHTTRSTRFVLAERLDDVGRAARHVAPKPVATSKAVRCTDSNDMGMRQ